MPSEREILRAIENGSPEEDVIRQTGITADALALIKRRRKASLAMTVSRNKRADGKRVLQPSGGKLARFKAPKAKPWRVTGLANDHKAIVDGRSLFPSRTKGPMESQRMLHVFGYTSRRDEDGEEPLSRHLAFLLDGMNKTFPDRWVIRTSHKEAGPMRSIVVKADPKRPDVIVCPAMVEKTATCGTCTLCWAEATRDKTIAFLLHGAF